MTQVERELSKDREKFEQVKMIQRLFAKYMREFSDDRDRSTMAVAVVMDLSYNTVKKYVQ